MAFLPTLSKLTQYLWAIDKFLLEWTRDWFISCLEKWRVLEFEFSYRYQSVPVRVFKSHNLDHQDWIYNVPNLPSVRRDFVRNGTSKAHALLAVYAPLMFHYSPHSSLIFNSFDSSRGNCNTEHSFHHFYLFTSRRNPSVAEKLGFRRTQQQSGPEARRRKPLLSKVQSLRRNTFHADNIHVRMLDDHHPRPVTCDILVFSVNDCMNDGNVSRSVGRSNVKLELIDALFCHCLWWDVSVDSTVLTVGMAHLRIELK